jgi:hypothetical protein
MQKITGKALSLALSIALVASSFSASFASAATKTVTGSVDLKDDDAVVLYLVNGAKDSQQGKVNLTDWINTQQKTDKTTMDTTDHQEISSINITDVSHVSGDKLLKWGDVNGSSLKSDDPTDCYLFLKSSTASGKELISVMYSGSYTDGDGNSVTVKARQNITVNVADYGSVYIGKYYSLSNLTGAPTADNRVGKSIEDISSLAVKSDAVATQTLGASHYVDKKQAGVYYATPNTASGSESCLATYSYQSFNLDASNTGAIASGSNPAAASAGFTLKLSGSTNSLKFAFDAVNTLNGFEIYSLDGAAAGNISITAIHSSDITKNQALAQGILNTKVTAKARIDQKVKVTTGNYVNIGKDKNTYLYKSDTSVSSGAELTGAHVTDGTKINVTGYAIDLALPTADSVFTIDDKSASVGKITGSINGTVKISAGSVSSVDLDNGNVTVDANAKVGDITLDSDSTGTYASIAGNVTTDGKVGDIDAAGTVTVSSGSTGAINADGAIALSASDDSVTTTVGAVTSSGETTVDSADSKVTVSSYKASDNNAKLTLSGNAVTIGKIDFDSRDNTSLSLDDFQGTLPAPVNASKATVETNSEDDNVTFTGAAAVNTLDLTDSSRATFGSTLKADYITGSGILKLPLGGLYVTEGVSGSPILKFSDSFKVGDTAFKADSDAVAVDDFSPYGYTLSKTEGTSADTFTVASVQFAGIAINKDSSSIAKGYSETFTASAYPGGTSLPAGDQIVWDLDGSDNIFTLTSTGASATVKVNTVDSNFASENKATLTATVYDADGYALDDYEVATCDVTATALPAAISDTNSSLFVAKGASYVMKVTSATKPAVGVGTNGVFSVTLLSQNGNDYLYKLTATGTVGSATGVYLNGSKIFVATVNPNFKSDTTMNTTVKGSYTFKVTANTAPAVTVGSGNLKLALVSKSGNDYFYKITSASAVGSSAGIYVNGTRVFIAFVG